MAIRRLVPGIGLSMAMLLVLSGCAVIPVAYTQEPESAAAQPAQQLAPPVAQSQNQLSLEEARQRRDISDDSEGGGSDSGGGGGDGGDGGGGDGGDGGGGGGDGGDGSWG